MLYNIPHGDNAQDAQTIALAEAMIEFFDGFGVQNDTPLIIYNAVPTNANLVEVNENNENAEDDVASLETDPSASVSSESQTDSNGRMTSDNNSENSADRHSDANFEDFGVPNHNPLIINNVVPINNNLAEVSENNENAEDDLPSLETSPSATVSSASSTDSNGTMTSDNDSKNSADPHSDATFEDSELEVSQRARRMKRKRKHSWAAVQHSDSTSEDEHHPVFFRTKRRCINKRPRTSETQETPETETFSGPSRETERHQKRKRKYVTLQDKNPVDSESSDETPLTGSPRKRPRKETENVTEHGGTTENVGEDNLTVHLKKKRKRQNNEAENETSLSEHEESLHHGPLKKKRTNHGNSSEHK